MLTRHAITRRAEQDQVEAAVVERDYILSHIVAQLHHAAPTDGGRLVFKGGTALRLVHVADYRYSADLDFTVVDGAVAPALAALGDVLAAAKRHAALPHLELTTDAPPEIAYIGPLGAARLRPIKLDVASDEHVESVEQRTIRDIWPDLPEPVTFPVYSIEEIAAEKLRCVIQRVQCRDLYDLFRLTEDMNVSLSEIRPLFEQKTRAKGLDPGSFRDRLADRTERYRQRWDVEIGGHIADPPRFDDVLRAVRRRLRAAGFLDE
jgi:predicted nucleotidyltransferase component of viral defense system